MSVTRIVIQPLNEEWVLSIFTNRTETRIFKTYKEAIDYLARSVPEADAVDKKDW